MKKNTASQVICAQLVSATDGSAVTSGTTDVYVLGNGGTQASSGTATHEGNGCWSYAPSQAETNYDHIAFTFVNASAINATVNVYTGYPQTGDSYAQATAIKAKTDLIPAAPAAVGDIPTAVENADALLNRDMSTGTDSGSETVRTVRQALRFLRNKWSISGSTLTVTKEDDSTASWTAAVTTNASADPITGSDPASS